MGGAYGMYFCLVGNKRKPARSSRHAGVSAGRTPRLSGFMRFNVDIIVRARQ